MWFILLYLLVYIGYDAFSSSIPVFSSFLNKDCMSYHPLGSSFPFCLLLLRNKNTDLKATKFHPPSERWFMWHLVGIWTIKLVPYSKISRLRTNFLLEYFKKPYCKMFALFYLCMISEIVEFFSLLNWTHLGNFSLI